jgi:hypothetical protein
MITGPTPGATTVALNSAGVGRFVFNIFSFGTYSVVVTVNGQEVSGTATVDASSPGCP